MKFISVLMLARCPRCAAGPLVIDSETPPGILEPAVLAPATFETGFDPAHAPPGQHAQQQVDAALELVGPLENGILPSTINRMGTCPPAAGGHTRPRPGWNLLHTGPAASAPRSYLKPRSNKSIRT